MRQVVLDTETTGIGHESGHRIIEIGCIEIIDRKVSSNHFHIYLNPQREVDEGAFRVHGISSDFLKDKPLFKDVLDDFLRFIKGAELIIHNAAFDVGFLNAEFKHAKFSKPIADLCTVTDTLVMARDKHRGQRNSLDALCKRYDIDNSNRKLHGALLDAEILAHVYLAMTGGQGSLFEDDNASSKAEKIEKVQNHVFLSAKTPVIKASESELALHNEFIEFFLKKAKVNHWQEIGKID